MAKPKQGAGNALPYKASIEMQFQLVPLLIIIVVGYLLYSFFLFAANIKEEQERGKDKGEAQE